MAVLTIKTLNEELRKESKDVEIFGLQLKNTVSDMIETMYFHNGIGLSGIQIGIDKKILVYDSGFVKGLPYGKEFKVMINPKIISFTEAKEIAKEGCLSFVGLDQKVIRSKGVLVEYYTVDNEFKTSFFEGLEARVIQHEIDHFYGITLYLRASNFKRKRYDKNRKLGKI